MAISFVSLPSQLLRVPWRPTRLWKGGNNHIPIKLSEWICTIQNILYCKVYLRPHVSDPLTFVRMFRRFAPFPTVKLTSLKRSAEHTFSEGVAVPTPSSSTSSVVGAASGTIFVRSFLSDMLSKRCYAMCVDIRFQNKYFVWLNLRTRMVIWDCRERKRTEWSRKAFPANDHRRKMGRNSIMWQIKGHFWGRFLSDMLIFPEQKSRRTFGEWEAPAFHVLLLFDSQTSFL